MDVEESDIFNSETINKTFESAFTLPDFILDVLKAFNYTRPTPIQYNSIPLGLTHHNIIGQAKAGTGKTLAYTTILLSVIEPKISNL